MKKFLATVSTVAIMGTVLVGGNAALAADPVTTSSEIKGSSLSVSTPTMGSFGTITLDGTIQEPQITLGSFDVIDPTGSGSGWNVVMKAGIFTDTVTGNSLPSNSLTIDTPTVVAGAGADPETTITTTGGTIDTTNGLKILSAELNGGMGTYSVNENTLTLELLPKDVKAGSYTSTVTITITTGP